MELRKVKTESVLENALDALKKVKSTDDEAVENIRSCMNSTISSATSSARRESTIW